MPESLFLDTCALIWLAEGGGRLSPATLQRIDDAPQVFVSPISAWEISLKEERGELTLPLPAEAWFPAIVEAHGLTLHPLGAETLIAANRLPWHHRDPADRFILASAKSLRASVVTADKRFPAYGVDVIL